MTGDLVPAAGTPVSRPRLPARTFRRVPGFEGHETVVFTHALLSILDRYGHPLGLACWDLLRNDLGSQSKHTSLCPLSRITNVGQQQGRQYSES
jgi:hypothetical protein